MDRSDEVSSKRFAGQRWLQKVLNYLWRHPHVAWKLRKANLHGVNDANQEAKRKAKLSPAIVALSKIAEKSDCLNKRLFDLPLFA